MVRAILLFVFTYLLVAPALSQSGSTDSTTTSGIYPLPILFYTPETGTAFGAAAMYLYRVPGFPRASTITGDVIYTTKKQIIVELDGDQYFDRGTYRLLAYAKYQRYPNKYFGIGNNCPETDEEDYTFKTLYFRGVLYRNISSRLNAGPAIRYENSSVVETASNGALARGIIPGSTGGTVAALGGVVNWDSRDNTIAAYAGSLYQLTVLFYRPALGSDFSFTDIQIDARSFYEVLPEQILAVQAIGEFMKGRVPFHYLARFGGTSLLRGYYDGRYRDKQLIALQAEYRIPVWWRFGIVGFAGAAQVADRISNFGLGRFWLAGGAGIRFAWNQEERVNLRVDYGIGNNSSGFYVTVTEAF
jgi:hypothetical protein